MMGRSLLEGRRPAVLLLTWKRASTLERVLQSLHELQPSALYVAGDGPRMERHGEAKAVQAAKNLVLSTSFNFQVHTSFSTTHLGLRENVLRGIDWFLEKEPEGVILEDDIVPTHAFFDFAQANLDKFQNDRRVSQIAGTNHSSGLQIASSPYFSRFQHVWGFATWRRSWSGFRSFWNTATVTLEDIQGFFPAMPRSFHRHWLKRIQRELRGQSDTWTSVWNYFCFLHERLSLVPSVTVVNNIGFGPEATHSKRTPLIAGGPPSSEHAGLGLPPTTTIDTVADEVRDAYVGLSHWGTQPPIQRLLLAAGELVRRQPPISGTPNPPAKGSSSQDTSSLTVAQHFYRKRVLHKFGPLLQTATSEKTPETIKLSARARNLPILLVAWRRPEKTGYILERLREFGLRKIYVHVDGPRKYNAIDEWACAETRATVLSYSRDFQLKVWFRDSNIGVKRAVTEAVSWFFETEERGIVLEDDLLLTGNFFNFVADGLNKFRDDSSVSLVAGTTHSAGFCSPEHTAYLSRFHHIWGFGTWRQEWVKFCRFMDEEGSLRITVAMLERAMPGFSKGFYAHWAQRVNPQRAKEIEWDSLWNVFNFLGGNRSLSPTTPLVQNRGLDAVATHMRQIPLISGPAPRVTRDEPRFSSLDLATSQWDLADHFVAATVWNTLPQPLLLMLAGAEKLRRFFTSWRGRQNQYGPDKNGNGQYLTIAQKVVAQSLRRTTANTLGKP